MKAALTVALPLGIGDCHWSCQKLKALSEYHDGRPIHAYVSSSRWHDSVQYLDLVPFVTRAERSDAAPYSIATELPPHHQDPRWSTLEGCRNWQGFDYVVVANGHLERGERIETFLPELAADYTYELNIPEQERAKARALVPDGAVLLYLSGTGPNIGFHANKFTPRHWLEILFRLNQQGIRPYVVGAPTQQDREYRDLVLGQAQQLKLQFGDVVGDTSVAMVCDAMQRAAGWMGLNSGLGIVAAMMGTPTVMFWSDHKYPIASMALHTNMQSSWLGPDQLRTYRTFSYGDPAFTPEAAVTALLEVKR